MEIKYLPVFLCNCKAEKPRSVLSFLLFVFRLFVRQLLLQYGDFIRVVLFSILQKPFLSSSLSISSLPVRRLSLPLKSVTTAIGAVVFPLLT